MRAAPRERRRVRLRRRPWSPPSRVRRDRPRRPRGAAAGWPGCGPVWERVRPRSHHPCGVPSLEEGRHPLAGLRRGEQPGRSAVSSAASRSKVSRTLAVSSSLSRPPWARPCAARRARARAPRRRRRRRGEQPGTHGLGGVEAFAGEVVAGEGAGVRARQQGQEMRPGDSDAHLGEGEGGLRRGGRDVAGAQQPEAARPYVPPHRATTGLRSSTICRTARPGVRVRRVTQIGAGAEGVPGVW